MANIVEQIHDQIKSQTQTELGATWTEMPRVFDPTNNDLRSIKRSFGVLHGAAFSVEGITKVYTLDQTFTVLLATSFSERIDDDATQDEINTLYNQADELLKKFIASKLALPSVVHYVSNPSIDAPEILENSAVLLRVNFDVRYRSLIDS